MNYMNIINNEKCECGKTHSALIDECIVEKGAINKIPEVLKKYNCKKPFIVADSNTYKAAGKKVCYTLNQNGIEYSRCSGFHSKREILDLIDLALWEKNRKGTV